MYVHACLPQFTLVEVYVVKFTAAESAIGYQKTVIAKSRPLGGVVKSVLMPAGSIIARQSEMQS